MDKNTRILELSSLSYLVSASVGFVLASTYYLPADFLGYLNGQDVARDFLTFKGTALSPPLVLLVLQLIFTTWVADDSRWGWIGMVGLTILGVFYTITQLGEPVTLRALRFTNWGVSMVFLFNLLFAVLMAIFGWREWHRRTEQNADSADRSSCVW